MRFWPRKTDLNPVTAMLMAVANVCSVVISLCLNADIK